MSSLIGLRISFWRRLLVNIANRKKTKWPTSNDRSVPKVAAQVKVLGVRFTLSLLFTTNVHLPHNSQMQRDSANAAPLIWASARANQLIDQLAPVIAVASRQIRLVANTQLELDHALPFV